MPSPKLSTLAVQSGPRRHAHDALTGAVSLTSTYSFENTAELRRYFDGDLEREEYGRYGNPTVRGVEQKIAALDGAEACALFGSGMAAVTTSLLAVLKAGDHAVLTSDCYRRTRQFVGTFLKKLGVDSTLVEPGDFDALERAITPKTKLIVSESPTNPYLRVADLVKLAEVKSKHRGVLLFIDSTFATPVNQRPLELGADLCLHSATKYLGGHNDLLAGSVSGRAGLVQAIADLRGVLGGVLDPHSAYLLGRGLKTLPLRVRQHNANALAVAQWLEKQPAVQRVWYPGLESHPDHATARAQMSGFGGVVTFEVKGGIEAGSRLVDACRLARIAPSLGGVETLIEQPALMSFYELTTEQRLAIGIKDELIRLAVGVEDVDNIVGDLTRALDAAQSGGAR
ncbi:MAG: aminotransferase class I/II-fold pyridoxal phosphate-dependent enzyme [Archangiaceae bacterium]|nr:aminotransferase class I/II-fold pyridoxal phosphate-dependent enzyme [Archangiaceae bacterium]